MKTDAIIARKKAINGQIERINKELQATSIFDRKYRKQLKQKKIKALEEGQRDILTTDVTRSLVSSGVVNKNNYKTYSTKVQGAYEMYNGNSDYGGELCKGVVETRIAFIAGEGVSVVAKKPKTQEFIDNFMKLNKLHGSRLMDMITTGELEGKNVMTIEKGKEKVTTKAGREVKDIVKVKSLSWQHDKYTVVGEKDDYKTVKYKPENSRDDKVITSDKFVYVHLGGTDKDINIANSRLHDILTDIENYSRAKYDLRENTHLFGKYSPYFKTATGAEAKSINNDLTANPWEPGTSYAGSADFSIVEPQGKAAESIIKDMLNALKMVSLTMSIPIHFLAYPELMSNRATADNLMEVVIAGTRRDRLIWEEAFLELIEKAIDFAVNSQIASNDILGSEIKVKIPIVSIALLKQIIEIWKPLYDDNIISQSTFTEMLPGINYSVEKKFLKKEKEERMEDSPFQNNTINENLKKIQEIEENGEQD